MYKYAEFEQLYQAVRELCAFSQLKFCMLMHVSIVYVNTGMQNGGGGGGGLSRVSVRLVMVSFAY